VTAGDGIGIEAFHVDRAGPPGAPPMVLVHGFGASNHSWREWVPGLAEDYRLHLVELQGFGRSSPPADMDFSPLAQGRKLAEWLRDQGGPLRPVLVGHSLGAAVVLACALELEASGHPGAAAVIVVSGAVFPVAFPRYMRLARLPLVGDVLMALRPPSWALRFGIRGIVADPTTVSATQVAGYRAPLSSWRRRRTLLRAARGLRPEEDAAKLVPRYRELRAPVLALWGADDPVIPPTFAKRLAEAVPSGSAVLLSGVGHLPPEEAPGASLAAVRRFLSAST
jgi:pimeloyl-ACP methyl ester carboxylesterase